MRAIVHAGMPKTGTSAIQESYARTRVDGLHYLSWRGSNHTGLFVLLFDSRPESFPGFRASGATAESLARDRAEWQARLEAELSARPAPDILISGEGICGAGPATLARFRDWLGRFCDEIRVICYLRPPLSHMQSAFQQMLKSAGGPVPALPGRWPDYARRIARLDAAFGRENVTLRLFDRAALDNGDVVADFGNLIGHPLPPDAIRRVNESLSLEAVAALWVLRRRGQGLRSGARGALRANEGLLRALSRIGTSRLVIDPAVAAAVIAGKADEIAAIEARLGRPFRDPPPPPGRMIATADDLEAVALENADAIAAALARHLAEPRDDPEERLRRAFAAFGAMAR